MDPVTYGSLSKKMADPEKIATAVSDWLDDHPEATTTVQDGSITQAKLDSNLSGAIDDVSDLKNAIGITYEKGDSISPSATTNNFALDGAGSYVSATGKVLYQYLVTAGQYIYIDVDEYSGYGAYEFHTATGALSASNLIGDPYFTEFDGYIKVPTGAGRIAITGTSNDVPTVKQATRSSEIEKINDEIDGLSDDFEDLSDNLNDDINELTKKYDYIMYDFTDIDVGQTWSGMELDGSGGWAWLSGYTVKRYVVSGMSKLYLKLNPSSNANYEFHTNSTLASSSLIGTANNTAVNGLVEVPSTATDLFINYKNDDSSYYQVKKATNWKEEMDEKIDDLSQSTSKGSSLASASTKTASTLTICEDFHLKKGFTIDFYGEFSTYAYVEIGQGINVGQGRSIKITSSAIELYFGGSNGTTDKVLRKTENHGLTLANYIYVKIDVDRKSSIKVTLMSNGSTVTKDIGEATGGSGDCEAYISGTMTSVKGSVMATDSLYDVFIFGDSYVNPFATSYTKHLLMNGYTKFLLSGIPGGTGAIELDAFRTAVTLHKPKVALWALGMNDGGLSTWKTYADQFISICEEKGITPVLATIPNVADKMDNTGINSLVKSSGYRYVDFAKAVGAESADSTWYEGMLINNDIHPTDLGGIALMNMLFVDLPEIASAYDPNDVAET